MVRLTEGFLNVAHAQFLVVGAFVGLEFVEGLGVPVLLAGPLTFVTTGMLGVLVARLVFDPVRHEGSLTLIFTSMAVGFVLYGLIIAIFGTSSRVYPVDFGARFTMGSVSITVGEIVIIGLGVAVVVALWLFLTRTTIGAWVRAVASNPELAKLRGVRVQLVSGAVWFIAAGLAGLAGVVLGVVGNVNAEIGWLNLPLILAVAVLGGVGRIYGVIAAGLLLGLLMDLSALFIPTTYRLVVAFGALFLVLLVRPEGLFGVERRREQATR